jgi:glycosyltransferase involved in cell wall biosynthesis
VSRTVDVIVPCYNYGTYLVGCVRSLLDQTGVAVRVLVIDDCSTDNTLEVGLGVARSDERITFRRHTTNMGHIATYNEGFAWASSDYVLLISADDLLTPGALARAVDVMEANPGVAFVHGGQVVFADEPTLPLAAAAGRVDITPGRAFVESLLRAAHNPVATPTVVVRTAAQRAAGDYDPALPHTADMAMWMHLGMLGDVAAVDAVQAFKRHHGRNMQIEYTSVAERDIRERHAAVLAFLGRWAGDLPASGEWLAAAERTLALELVWHASALADAGRDKAARSVLARAAELHPTLRHSPVWTRVSVKLALGARVCTLLRRLTRPSLRFSRT